VCGQGQLVLNSVLLTQFNTCPPYSKVESKITRDFAAQCSLFTFSSTIREACHSIQHLVTWLI